MAISLRVLFLKRWRAVREGAVALAEGDDWFVEDDFNGVALFREGIRVCAGEEVVDGRGHAPYVGDGFHVFVVRDLLAGHEDGRAGVAAGHAHAAEPGLLEALGKSEICEADFAACDKDDVSWSVKVNV